jgi:hypothetical protein
MSDIRPLRLRAGLLATLSLLGGIAIAARVPDRPLPVRIAAAPPMPAAAGAPAALARATFAAG